MQILYSDRVILEQVVTLILRLAPAKVVEEDSATNYDHLIDPSYAPIRLGYLGFGRKLTCVPSIVVALGPEISSIVTPL